MFYAPYFDGAYFAPVWFAPSDEAGVPEEELRHEYRGNGSRHSYPARDPFKDDALVAIVRDKWEAIERAQAEDAAKVAELAELAERKSAELAEPGPETLPSILAMHWPDLPMATADDSAALKAIERRRREANDAAILMIMAEM